MNKALDMNGIKLADETLIIEKANTSILTNQNSKLYLPGNVLFISGLNFELTYKDLYEAFKIYGDLRNITMP